MVTKVLNVAEKNDAAKRIAEILSGRNKRVREGFSVYNKIYEFNYNLWGQNCIMVMTSLSGHMMNYEFIGSYKQWNSCHPSILFQASLEKTVNKNMVNIKRTLEREIRSCNSLIIWTDCDREGENIGYEVINLCKDIKPNIQVWRAKFSEITNRSVTNACNNLNQPNVNISNAVDARQELDLRIGAAFTRLQTLRLQKVFPEVLSKRLVSYGSCQFPTLGFVVERYKAREAFQSEDFWKIEVIHQQEAVNGSGDGSDLQTARFNWKRHRVFNELVCSVFHANCIEPPTIAVVTNVRGRPKSRWRPVALETVELEKLASRKLGLNAKTTMQLAEKLYTQGYISYPRTETNIFPKDIDLSRLVEDQIQHRSWGSFAESILNNGGPNPRNGSKSDKAHPPIHPTKFTDSLSGNEAKLYEFIVRHFLACCHKDAQGHETTVDIGLGGEQFSTQGLMITAYNYLEVYIYDRWNTKVIPAYEMGFEFEPTRIEMIKGSTSAPNLLTEADLIALMDKHGIGTDATHAEHIETIKSRLYVGLTADQRFTPGELGMGLVEAYNLIGYDMSQPYLRAELEADLGRICDGSARKGDVLRHHLSKYRAVFDQAVEKACKFDEALSVYFGQPIENLGQTLVQSTPVRPCPVCGADMVLKDTKSGRKMISCMGFPSCRNVAFISSAVRTIDVTSQVCPTCQPSPVHLFKLKLNRNQIPPYIECDLVACLGGCDQDLNTSLDIHFRCSNDNNEIFRTPNPPTPRASSSSSITSTSSRISSVTPRMLPTRPNRSGTSHRVQSSNHSQSSGHSLSQTITCNCNNEAVELMVRKEGPNKGRSFYKCPESACNFFQWSDGPQPQSKRPRTTQQEVSCRCNIPAVQRTVQKAGPNQGRVFMTCTKPMNEQCGFFEWLPDTGSDSGIASTSSSSKTQSSGKTRKSPTCSSCGQVGHTRRGCKNH